MCECVTPETNLAKPPVGQRTFDSDTEPSVQFHNVSDHCSDHYYFAVRFSQELNQSVSFGPANSLLVYDSVGAVAHRSAKRKLNDGCLVIVEEVL